MKALPAPSVAMPAGVVSAPLSTGCCHASAPLDPRCFATHTSVDAPAALPIRNASPAGSSARPHAMSSAPPAAHCSHIGEPSAPEYLMSRNAPSTLLATITSPAGSIAAATFATPPNPSTAQGGLAAAAALACEVRARRTARIERAMRMAWLHLRHVGAKSLRDSSESGVGPRLLPSDRSPAAYGPRRATATFFGWRPTSLVGKVLRPTERVRNDHL